jgi:hypothetical protein
VSQRFPSISSSSSKQHFFSSSAIGKRLPLWPRFVVPCLPCPAFFSTSCHHDAYSPHSHPPRLCLSFRVLILLCARPSRAI